MALRHGLHSCFLGTLQVVWLARIMKGLEAGLDAS